MVAIQSSATSPGHPIEAPKSSRRPLQPKNLYLPSITKPKSEWAHKNSDNKENIPPHKGMECFDASLADELTAIRERVDRLRVDRDKNEKLLRERGLMLDRHFKDILNRGEVQKQLEIEVDRLYRLKEIRLACTRISQIRSLRDKEQEKKMKQDNRSSSREGDEEKNEGRSQISISEVSP